LGIRDLCLGDGLDVSEYLGVIQLHGRDPIRVETAAHEAHLVRPMLKGGDSTTKECCQEVISHEPIFIQLINYFMNEDNIPVEIPWVIVLLQFSGGANNEFGQVDPIDIRGVFDIKESSEPLFT
jgi:hypothetical protein